MMTFSNKNLPSSSLIVVCLVDSSIEQLIKVVLAKRGHQVFSVRNENALFDVLRMQSVDRIILYSPMPNIDITRIQNQLLLYDNLSTIPVIVIFEMPLTESNNDYNATQFLSAPINPVELIQIIEA
jgi:PleD family two-component response regulator